VTHVATSVVGCLAVVMNVFILINNKQLIVFRQVLFYGSVFSAVAGLQTSAIQRAHNRHGAHRETN
jgi:hypothetical protein